MNYAMVSGFWHVALCCSCSAREDEGAPSPRLSLSEVSPDISLYPVKDVGARRIRISSEKREKARRATLHWMQMDNIGHGPTVTSVQFNLSPTPEIRDAKRRRRRRKIESKGRRQNLSPESIRPQ